MTEGTHVLLHAYPYKDGHVLEVRGHMALVGYSHEVQAYQGWFPIENLEVIA